MSATFSTFPIPGVAGKYGYRVEDLETDFRVVQRYAPGASDAVRMTLAQATAAAQALIAELQAAVQEGEAGTEPPAEGRTLARAGCAGEEAPGWGLFQ